MGADFTYNTFPQIRVNQSRIDEWDALADTITEENEDLMDNQMLETVDELIDFVKGVFKAFLCKDEFGYYNRRDIALIVIDNIPHYITGGMSWGDAPSDAYEDMDRFWEVTQYLPMFDDLLTKWITEDHTTK